MNNFFEGRLVYRVNHTIAYYVCCKLRFHHAVINFFFYF